MYSGRHRTSARRTWSGRELLAASTEGSSRTAGSQVAAKRARKLNGQYLSTELRRELKTLQKIEHQNLMRFLGFFEQKDETLIVVEYVDNGSLR
uniref:Protein kinase domain-containing protein n=1 Tax=Triticum urartu TaxID=4572 RepID=A0A8R7QK97_TRIUA